jgi:hypothetical protein
MCVNDVCTMKSPVKNEVVTVVVVALGWRSRFILESTKILILQITVCLFKVFYRNEAIEHFDPISK